MLLLCHSKHCEETSPESLAIPLLCHSEPLGEESLLSTKDSLSKTPKGTTSDSDRDSSPLAGVQNDNLREPLIYKRDSSLDSQAQNDNKSDPQDKITLQGKLVCHSEHYGESLRKATRESLSYCHSEGAQGATEESLKESLVAKRDSSLDSQAQNDKPTTFTKIPKSNDSQKAHRDSSPLAGVQNDKIISLAGSQVCHSEEARSATEESLLSTKDSLTKSLERRLLCHSKSSIKGEELFLKTPKSTTSDSNRDSSPSARVQNDKLCYPQKKFSQDDNVACMRGKLFCHSERSEESLKESLVTHRDSSPLAGVQNDNSGRVSSNSKRDSSAFANSRNNKLYVLMGNRLSHTQGKLTPHNNPTHSNTRRSVC